MTNNGIEKARLIDRARLSEENYFQTLLECAGERGLLVAPEIERLQYECVALLARVTERLNKWESSSIRVERAESLLASILFTVGLRLKNFDNPDDAAAALKSGPVTELFAQWKEAAR